MAPETFISPVNPGTTVADAFLVERVRAVNHHLKLALDQVSDAVWIAQREPDGECVIVYANAPAARWTGLEAERLRGVPLASLLSDAALPAVRAALQSAAETGEAECRVGLLKPAAEDPAPRVCRVVAVPNAGGEIVNFQFILRPPPPPPAAPPKESAAPAGPPPQPSQWHADMVETIRETARQVAHEFNNALTSIMLPVGLAMDSTPRKDATFEQLEVAYDSAQRASELVGDFLACFRPRPAMRERTRPTGFLSRSVRLATCGRNISATCEIAPDLLEVRVDETQLERVIFNLVRNAAQAMPGGGRLRVKATNIQLPEKSPLGLPAGPYVQISVRDWGPGIPPQHLHHLFHSRFTTKPDGNGCGLAICHRIIRDHGGEMQVRSRVNVGTEFLIYLPALPPDPPGAATLPGEQPSPEAPAEKTAAPPPPAPKPSPVPAPAPPPPPALLAAAPPMPPAVAAAGAESEAPRKPLLLVIDDEHTVLEAIRQLAVRCGYDVIVAEDSTTGLQAFRERLLTRRRCDAVLLDMNLRQGLSGEEIFKELRRLDPDVPVLASSGQHDENEERRRREMGFAGFLPKPYQAQQFKETMRALLASRRETPSPHHAH